MHLSWQSRCLQMRRRAQAGQEAATLAATARQQRGTGALAGCGCAAMPAMLLRVGFKPHPMVRRSTPHWHVPGRPVPGQPVWPHSIHAGPSQYLPLACPPGRHLPEGPPMLGLWPASAAAARGGGSRRHGSWPGRFRGRGIRLCSSTCSSFSASVASIAASSCPNSTSRGMGWSGGWANSGASLEGWSEGMPPSPNSEQKRTKSVWVDHFVASGASPVAGVDRAAAAAAATALAAAAVRWALPKLHR